MSIHSDLMRSASDVLFAVQGDAGAVSYCRESGKPFKWPGASAGAHRGGMEENESTGDLVKVTRMTVTGPTAELVKHKVVGLERNATVETDGLSWSIDLLESAWGPTIVRLGLIRRPITRHQEMESADDGRG